MKNGILISGVVCLLLLSCTKAKTDYEAERNAEVPVYYDFKEAALLHTDNYVVHIEALNGKFYKGYNPIRVRITDTSNDQTGQISSIAFFPFKENSDGSRISCPHQYHLQYHSDSNYFSGYVVFVDEDRPNESSQLYVSFTTDNKSHYASGKVKVLEQPNKNLGMTAFVGNDDIKYLIALVSPYKPKVGENDLVAGIYQCKTIDSSSVDNFPFPVQYYYTEVMGYKLLLDPRMPEPSMGNHSSPNNEDLIQLDDGLYHGVVNYTMTGNWTLNFILLNPSGNVVKGMEVSKDFTPGVEGAKSELHIDILF